MNKIENWNRISTQTISNKNSHKHMSVISIDMQRPQYHTHTLTHTNAQTHTHTHTRFFSTPFPQRWPDSNQILTQNHSTPNLLKYSQNHSTSNISLLLAPSTLRSITISQPCSLTGHFCGKSTAEKLLEGSHPVFSLNSLDHLKPFPPTVVV